MYTFIESNIKNHTFEKKLVNTQTHNKTKIMNKDKHLKTINQQKRIKSIKAPNALVHNYRQIQIKI